MTHKHTPGPWTVVSGHYPSMKEISGPSFKINCVMWASDLTEADYAARDADLSLIAAAPDLLAALELVVSEARVSDAGLSIALDVARAAITKATK